MVHGVQVEVVMEGQDCRLSKLTYTCDLKEQHEEAVLNNVWPRPKLHLKPPFPCCYDDRPVSVAKAWLFQCKLMALQFVLCKPVLGLAPLLFHLLFF